MTIKYKNRQFTCGFLVFLITRATTVCLAVGLFAAGFATCMQPFASNLLIDLLCDDAANPYLEQDLKALARETRDYTTTDYGRKDGGSEAALERISLATTLAAQHSAAPDSAKAALWPQEATELLFEPIAREDPVETTASLAQISHQLALGENELSHLDDCHTLMDKVRFPLILIALAGLVGVITLGVSGRRQQAGTALMAGPGLLAAALIVLAFWAAVDFSSLFSLFHRLLFPQGNWTFPADSLLICMLPLGFWVSMAALWLAVSLPACIIATLLGRRLRKVV